MSSMTEPLVKELPMIAKGLAMTAASPLVPARRQQASEAHGAPGAWLPVAGVLLGTGWGANQITPMLLVYERALDISTGTVEAMFGAYALGLIPGLLLAGPLSDARGRRTVVLPAGLLSLLATSVLVAGAHEVALLFLGRILAGISSGAVFGAGTAWLREVSRAPYGSASNHQAARRAAIAMTSGFALGPLCTGLIAQWAPADEVLPYLPHIALMLVVLPLLAGAPETVKSGAARFTIPLSALRDARLLAVVAPMAPWVFAAPAIAFALLPSVLGVGHGQSGIAMTAAITALCAFTGVIVQPLGRRLDARSGRDRAAAAGLSTLVAGLGLAALTAVVREEWLLFPSAIALGAAYGLCLVAGLVEVQRIAPAGALAGLSAIYYALAYLGFAAPFLLALGTEVASYGLLLGGCALLAAATLVHVAYRGRQAGSSC
jgi:hypothetical protein